MIIIIATMMGPTAYSAILGLITDDYDFYFVNLI